MASKSRIGTDLAWRSGGLALWCLAAFVGYTLFGAGARSATFVDYPLAAVGFLAASLGSAMVWQGGHLLDEVVLSSRWTAHLVERADRSGPARDPVNNPARRSAASS